MAETNKNVRYTLVLWCVQYVFTSTQGHSFLCPSPAALTLCFVLILSNWHGNRPCNKTVVRSGQGKAKAPADNERKTTSSIPSPPSAGDEGPDLIAFTEKKHGSRHKRCFKYLDSHPHTQQVAE